MEQIIKMEHSEDSTHREYASRDSKRYEIRMVEASGTARQELIASAEPVMEHKGFQFLENIVAAVNNGNAPIQFVFYAGQESPNTETFGVIVIYENILYKILVHYHPDERSNYIHAKFYENNSYNVMIKDTLLHDVLEDSPETRQYFSNSHHKRERYSH